MLSRTTQEAIEIIKRMDLKVAIPQKFTPINYDKYNGSATTDIVAQTINVPSIITALEFEIEQAYLQINDVKKATAILLDIKRNHHD